MKKDEITKNAEYMIERCESYLSEDRPVLPTVLFILRVMIIIIILISIL